MLDRAKWDEDAVRDALRTYVCEVLADPPAILILDETGFLSNALKLAKVKLVSMTTRFAPGTAGIVM